MPAYQRVQQGQLPSDAVVVRVFGDGADPTGAAVAWPAKHVAGRQFDGGQESVPDVPSALTRAGDIAGQYGLPRVVVELQRDSLWRPEWGTLEPAQPQSVEHPEGRSTTAEAYPLGDFDLAVRDTAYFLWEQEGRPEGRADEFWQRALDQHIRERAYSIWLQEGKPEGRAEENWDQANSQRNSR